MTQVHTPEEMQGISHNWQKDKTIGFVPTMGFLHEGHLSLVKESNKQCDITIVSIFVNPAQFGASEDLGSYPRNMERDLQLLSEYKVDYVFIPTAEDIYPKPYRTWVNVEGISELLCGASRPGHFRGVATVVLKLVNLVNPDLMFMGEKDFQQVAVLKTMLKDLNLRTKIVSCPIVREADGLAMSSRNTYLTGETRQQALCLSKAIHKAKQLFSQGITDTKVLLQAASEIIIEHNAEINYIQFVHPETLLPAEIAVADTRMILAVKVGKTRLIDNAQLGTLL
ncbi:MAG: pantoate--beta-alanine ligase [Candidatus Cloacimonetes bacterium]|nr:pantoate--beta-alanine ligase [Candidatus Cloacimonadota bacterium]